MPSQTRSTPPNDFVKELGTGILARKRDGTPAAQGQDIWEHALLAIAAQYTPARFSGRGLRAVEPGYISGGAQPDLETLPPEASAIPANFSQELIYSAPQPVVYL